MVLSEGDVPMDGSTIYNKELTFQTAGHIDNRANSPPLIKLRHSSNSFL